MFIKVFSIVLVVFAAAANSLALEFDWKPLMEPGSGGRIVSLSVSPHDSNRVLVAGDMLGVGLSNDRGDSWDITLGFDSYEMADFTWHPADAAIVWVGSMSGPYKSTDGGRNWVSKRKGMGAFDGGMYSAPIQKVLIDPNNANRLIAVGGSHRRWSSPGSPKWGVVWESLDAGESWKQVGTIKGKNILAAGFAAGSSDVLYAAVDQLGVYISQDGGRKWAEANQGLPSKNINWIEPHPSEAGTAFVAMGNHKPSGAASYEPGGIYKTVDFGSSWMPKSKGLAQNKSNDANQTARYEIVVVSHSNPNVLFTGNSSWSENNPYITKDGGETWKSTAGKVTKCYPAGKSMECAGIDPNNENYILGAGSEYILRSRDGGATWDDATAVQPAGSKLWRGRGYSGLVCTDFKWDPRDPNHAALSAMDGGNFWHSRDNLFSWEKAKSPVGSWGGGNELCFSGTSTMFVALGQYNFEGIGRTIDSGKKWQVFMGAGAGLPNQWDSKKVTSIYALPNDSSQVWAAIGGALYYSKNTGATWSVIFNGASVEKVAGAQTNPLHLYLATSKGVYESQDGQKFASIAGPTPATKVLVDPQDENVAYAVSWRQAGGLSRYQNGSWERINDNYYTAGVTVHPTNSNIIAVVTNDHPYHDDCYATGVYLTEDGGGTWTLQNHGLPVLRGETISFNPHNGDQIVVGTSGRGYFISGFDATKVESRTEVTPTGFRLLPNVPNPFNPQTTLRFQIDEPSTLEIAILNILGEQVRQWSERFYDVGQHSLVWDGRDDAGAAVAGGVYVVRIVDGSQIAVQKILLVK